MAASVLKYFSYRFSRHSLENMESLENLELVHVGWTGGGFFGAGWGVSHLKAEVDPDWIASWEVYHHFYHWARSCDVDLTSFPIRAGMQAMRNFEPISR